LDSTVIGSAAMWTSPLALGLFGLLIGSFLNVVIHRLPIMLEREWWGIMAEQLSDADAWQRATGRPRPAACERVGEDLGAALAAQPPLTLWSPPSRCGACGHRIRWYENVPLASWLALRARCSACKTPISVRYPLVELATGLLFAGAGWHFGPQWTTLAWCAFIAMLVAMAVIDQDTGYLPDDLTVPTLWGGLIAAALGWTIPFAEALWGAVAGFMALWLLAMAWKLLRKSEGMGSGDFKLLAALCAWLGWHALLPIVLMASIVGVLVNLPLLMLGKQEMARRIPFGPFLIGGGLVVMFAGADELLASVGVALPG
jgi:leader peptidase (prepilin peptidase)/N-methyltransferase